MNNYLLDTNVLIYQLRDNVKMYELLDELKNKGKIYISTVSRTEIFAGMRPNEETRTLKILNETFSLTIDDDIADHAGRLIYQYARQGVTLSFPDALIAATALEHDLTLVTTNAKHFPMPALSLLLVEQTGL